MENKEMIKSKLFDIDQRSQVEERGGILLIELTQLQEMKVKVEMSNAEIARLDGPLDEVKWGDTKLACATIINALTRSGVIGTEELFTKTSFVREHVGGAWNTSVSLYCSRELSEDFLKIITAIIQETLQAMIRDPRHSNKDAFEMELSENHRKTVKDVTLEALSKIGGRHIRYPINAKIPRLEACILDGKFAPKPSRAKFEPVVVQLMGRVRGFIHSHEKCVIFFDDQNKKLIEIAFDPAVVGGVLDLFDLTRWNMESIDCHVQANQTISSNGAEQFTLARFFS